MLREITGGAAAAGLKKNRKLMAKGHEPKIRCLSTDKKAAP